VTKSATSEPRMGGDGELGRGEERRPLQHLAEQFRDRPVSHRVGRGGVDWARDVNRVKSPEDQGDLVIDVDPGHVWIAAGEGASAAELEDRKQLLQQPGGACSRLKPDSPERSNP
jgi:hypothetical protein